MLKLFLYPLSLVYGAVVYLRNFCYDYNIFKTTEFEVPIIAIGNITVGGTGKTPHTEYLISMLQKHGKVATLSRGYKRKTKGFRLVESTSAAGEVGDEPLQMKRKFPSITVAVDENRAHGINELLKDPANAPDAILLDDAYQHRSVTPGINILLIDYNHPLEKDKLLPLGRLRERRYQQRRASIIIYTKCPNEISPITRRIIQKDVNLRPYQSLYFTTLEYSEPVPVFAEKANPLPVPAPINQNIILLTGIAKPEPFKNHLEKKAKVLDHLVFPDHHAFGPKDQQMIEERFFALKANKPIVVTTEKDAVRLAELNNLPAEIKENLYYIPINIKFLDSEGKSFDKKIVGYVKDNRSNRELHQRTHWA